MTFYLQTYPYRRAARRWAENRDRTLGINVREEDEAYILSALVPGLSSDELKIQVLEDVVRIEGEYKIDDSNYLVRELPQGASRGPCACQPSSTPSTLKRRSPTVC